ncbi:hypothetical protein EDC04DRAFT_2908168 [Pisolithus marmoratus]|nr:hypothetical protein EDC04DRAFT_2908168 [Pisolithus marmoratus]
MIFRSRRLPDGSSAHQWQSQGGYAPVTVDTRALIDKVLARYSGEFTVFRELLQNSDDAGCDSAEIRFESKFLGVRPEATMIARSSTLPDLETTNVAQWTFKNHGKPFTQDDWDRLPRIALGNPDPQKVGTFGVGFYSLFSVTDTPHVSSGGKEMAFSWKPENQLCYRVGNHPQTATRDLWTTFKMPLREHAPMPPVSQFMQFLASSITFMVHLRDVTVFFNHHRVGKINRSLGEFQVIPIPTELKPSSPKENMIVKSVAKYRKSFQSLTIKAEIIHSPSDSMPVHESKMDLVMFTAEVDVTAGKMLSKELYRCTKKNLPTHLKYSLIYTGKDEYDQSRTGEQKLFHESTSAFRGLRADLDGATHTRIFIGHATAQTTGIGGHMASCFIPTVERESIDLVDRNVAIWNRELLYVGGFLCRLVYEFELSKIQGLWDEAADGKSQSRKLEDQHFLHLLKFFTFHHSTPSPRVAELLAKSFYGCSTLPIRLLSSVGVRRASDIRVFDPAVAKFLKFLPMLSEDVTRDCARSIAALRDHYKISSVTPSDVLQELSHHTLDIEELVACLRWWITWRRNSLTSNPADLLRAASLQDTGGVIRLSSITYFIDPNVLGLHIPPDGPLPSSLIPLGVSKYFGCTELISFGWKEFTVTSWLQHVLRPEVMSSDAKWDFTRSVDWASCVLSTLSRIWPQLSEDTQSKLRDMLMNKPCIPTSKGLCCPEGSYLPIADNTLFHHLGLPIVSDHSRFKVGEDTKQFLLFIGVRTDPPVRFLLDRMLSKGDWTVFKLVEYLLQEARLLTDEDLDALTSSEIFMREGNEEEITRHRANELYTPVDDFRRLGLPVIRWSGKSEWTGTSPEAQLLYRLGLNDLPPLPKIVELCSSRDVGVQETAFVYLCDNLHSHYLHYKPENFCDTEFIPAEKNGRTCLKKLGEVYSGIQWTALGFFVVQGQYLRMPLSQLGVTKHPPTSKLLDLLENTPPSNEVTAARWFEILSDHISCFSSSDLIKLSGLPIVPIGPSSTPKLLPPAKCYLDQGTIPPLYRKLFVFVNLGAKANRFLSACSLKSTVSLEDVAKALIENPANFFELAGGYEGFLDELRKLAYRSQDISNDTLDKMCHTRSLLGMCRKKTQGKTGWDYEYEFLTYEEVTIVDDIDGYQLFSDCLFIAPRESVLERFYALLGCSYLSAVIKESCNDLHEISDAKSCQQVQSLVLERLPLFIENYTDTKREVAIPSGPDYLTVRACERILVSKTLVTRNVKKTRDVWAIARQEGDCIVLWTSKTAKCDMYDVATSLCRLLFDSDTMDAAAHLERILSADSGYLRRRGYLVDQTSQQCRDGYRLRNRATEQRSAGSASTIDFSQQSTPDTQPNPHFNREKLPRSAETIPQFPSSPHATDKSLDTARHPAFLLLSRTPREVIPQSYIRSIAETAIKSHSSEGGKPAIRAEASQCSSSAFCRMPADVGCLRSIGQVKSIEVCIDDGVPDIDTFMERMHGPLGRFVDIIITLSEIYRISTTTLRVFYDTSAGCIAFNCGGIIYLNLRYFEVWREWIIFPIFERGDRAVTSDDEQVKNNNRRDAQMSWFLALAHEIAHNLTDLHNSDHEFWFSAICEARLVAFSQLLQLANPWLRYTSWLRLIVIAVLFGYFAKHMTLVTNIPH